MTVDTLLDFASNPAVASLIVGLLTALLPAERVHALYSQVQRVLERFPIAGVLFLILRLYIERVSAAAVTAKLENAESMAKVLVSGAEQLKTINKLDAGSAERMVTKKLAATYGLDEITARTVTESAVRQMHSSDAHLH
jgi:hypothetical protein